MNLPQLYSTCSVHGLFENRRLVYKLRDAETTWKVRNRKMLTLKELPIECLMLIYLHLRNIYIYINYIYYIQILLTNIYDGENMYDQYSSDRR